MTEERKRERDRHDRMRKAGAHAEQSEIDRAIDRAIEALREFTAQWNRGEVDDEFASDAREAVRWNKTIRYEVPLDRVVVDARVLCELEAQRAMWADRALGASQDRMDLNAELCMLRERLMRLEHELRGIVGLAYNEGPGTIAGMMAAVAAKALEGKP